MKPGGTPSGDPPIRDAPRTRVRDPTPRTRVRRSLYSLDQLPPVCSGLISAGIVLLTGSNPS
jgi:hypothetical protein